MFGSLVNATAVAISTIGLIAGADSMNASDADGRTPRSISRFEIGTEPHSQPGSAAPQTPATGTARAALLGMIRVKTRGRHERGDGAGHHDAEHQERGGLHADGDEDRRPALHDRDARGTTPAGRETRWPATGSRRRSPASRAGSPSSRSAVGHPATSDPAVEPHGVDRRALGRVSRTAVRCPGPSSTHLIPRLVASRLVSTTHYPAHGARFADAAPGSMTPPNRRCREAYSWQARHRSRRSKSGNSVSWNTISA